MAADFEAVAARPQVVRVVDGPGREPQDLALEFGEEGQAGILRHEAGFAGAWTATLGQGPTPPQSRCAKLVRQACAVDPPAPSPYLPSTSERVAQPVEHLTFNQEVLGSSPSALTNKINALVAYA